MENELLPNPVDRHAQKWVSKLEAELQRNDPRGNKVAKFFNRAEDRGVAFTPPFLERLSSMFRLGDLRAKR